MCGLENLPSGSHLGRRVQRQHAACNKAVSRVAVAVCSFVQAFINALRTSMNTESYDHDYEFSLTEMEVPLGTRRH